MIRVSWPACWSAPESCATPMLRPIGQSKFGQMNWTFMTPSLPRSLRRSRLVVARHGSERAIALEDRRNGPQENAEVQPEGPTLHVCDVVVVDFEERERPAPPDLRKTRDSWLHVEFVQMLGGVVADVLGNVGTRADERHVALEHADEIRQLVEARPPEPAADRGDPRVVDEATTELRVRRDLPGVTLAADENLDRQGSQLVGCVLVGVQIGKRLAGVCEHGTELVQGEWAPELLLVVIAGAAVPRPLAPALLPEQGGAGGVALDEERDHQHQRGEQGEREQRDRQVERPYREPVAEVVQGRPGACAAGRRRGRQIRACRIGATATDSGAGREGIAMRKQRCLPAPRGAGPRFRAPLQGSAPRLAGKGMAPTNTGTPAIRWWHPRSPKTLSKDRSVQGKALGSPEAAQSIAPPGDRPASTCGSPPLRTLLLL